MNGPDLVVIDVHGFDDDTVESEQQGTTTVGHARAFASGCVENTQFTRARALNQSPTRTRSVTPDPAKSEEPVMAGSVRTRGWSWSGSSTSTMKTAC
jgi:hypothetical protein